MPLGPKIHEEKNIYDPYSSEKWVLEIPVKSLKLISSKSLMTIYKVKMEFVN